MNKIISILILCTFLISACGAGMAGKTVPSSGPFELSAAKVMAAKTGEVTGAFVTIKNNSGKDDRLVGAWSDAAEMSQVHETRMENNVMTMKEIAGVDIPAGAILELRHGSYHIMMMNLKKDLNAGDTVMVTLKFEKAGEVSVPMMVMAK